MHNPCYDIGQRVTLRGDDHHARMVGYEDSTNRR
jgi:hypothetical protein